MNKEMAKALEGSIDKWQKIVDHLHRKRKIDREKMNILERGSSNCPLCKLFLGNDCRGCPVSEATSLIYCAGTSYVDFHYAFATWRNIADMKKYAKAELEFLKSLR